MTYLSLCGPGFSVSLLPKQIPMKDVVSKIAITKSSASEKTLAGVKYFIYNLIHAQCTV